jgi:Rrf2 family iron-sulfur cluster assembly transcriptional regulator
MTLTKAARYALLAAIEMASSPDDVPVTVAVVARRCSVPETALAKVFQRLVHSGLAVGTRGVHGGYRLAREAAEISVLDVLDAVTSVPSRPREDARQLPRSRAVSDRLGRLFDDVDGALRARLASVTLATLVAEGTAGLVGPHRLP